MGTSVYRLDLPHDTGLKMSFNESILTDDLADLASRLQIDSKTKVVIFNSDVPRLFVAHFDLGLPSLAKLVLPQVTIGAAKSESATCGSPQDSTQSLASPKPAAAFSQEEGAARNSLAWSAETARRNTCLVQNNITAADTAEIGWINKAVDKSVELYHHAHKLSQRLRLFPLSALDGGKEGCGQGLGVKPQGCFGHWEEISGASGKSVRAGNTE
ncbi:hypothetical protein ACJZ2D_012020 [Fusarium nematophilum]